MKIGFKNFKKFADFPPIELNPITFIVGPNNSGKSSFIKAVTLILDNLKRNKRFNPKLPPISYISFWDKSNSNYNWGDYQISLNSNSEGAEMCFTLSEYVSSISISLSSEPVKSHQDKGDLLSVPIRKFCFQDNDVTINFELNCKPGTGNKDWRIKYSVSFLYLKKWLSNKISFNLDNIETYLATNLRLSYLESESEIEEDQRLNPISYVEARRKLEEEIKEHPEKESICIENPFEIKNEDILTYAAMKCCESKLWEKFHLENSPLYPTIFYIETHNAKHRIAIPTNDRNDYLGQTIIDYVTNVSQKISYFNEDQELRTWICKWLYNFKIGDNFNIEIRDGAENAIVQIYSGTSKTMLGLLGTGSIQLFILLLKIAIAIKYAKEGTNILILVEEPEQNLHPALQSLLADLFKDVVEISEGRIKFLIETHSEYLIRSTQVIVAKEAKKNNWSDNDLHKNNPFRVYYFPKEGLPYDMRYMINGRFAEKFGSGFFDEASNLAFEIF